MPNWCYNKLTLIGSEEEIANAKKLFLDEEEQFSFSNIIPMPEDIDDWYHWCTENWGTKWDVRGDVSYASYVLPGNHYYWSMDFSTAWGPAVPVVMAMSDNFPGIIHYYYDEPGMDFSGLIVLRNGDSIEENDFGVSLMVATDKCDAATYLDSFYYE